MSNRSWSLLICSTITPITVVSFRIATLDQRRTIAAAAGSVVGTVAGIVPDILFFIGILCFIGFLFSLLFEYFHARRSI
jgi:hypothetical protein